MGVAKRTRKFAQVKRIIGKNDARLKENKAKADAANAKKTEESKTDEVVREIAAMPSNLFFQHNTALVPPYNVLIDTNFVNHSVSRKLDLLGAMMDCLYAKCNIIITQCVMAELEKLGPRYRLALKVARDERWERYRCQHKGTYADDCIVQTVQAARVYIVATNDKDLQRRIRKIPGVPILKVGRGKMFIERLPGAPDS